MIGRAGKLRRAVPEGQAEPRRARPEGRRGALANIQLIMCYNITRRLCLLKTITDLLRK